MPTIHVSPLHLVALEAQRLKPSRLVTLLSPGGAMPQRPAHLAAEQHLIRLFHDIEIELDDLIPPRERDVQAVIDFARAWDRKGPLLIHCFAGISRSTAAALIAGVAIDPDQDEERLVGRLRAASLSASPNIRMISMADVMLDRRGRLVDAVMDLDTPQPAATGAPFHLRLA